MRVVAIAIVTATFVMGQVSTPWAQPAGDAKARAAAAAKLGEKRFQSTDYAGAVEQFKTAYELDPDPGFLFNIAQAYRLSGDCANAADYYEQFLAKVPAPRNREKIETWLAEQRACAKPQVVPPKPDVVAPRPPRPPPPPPPSPPPPSDPGRTKRRIAIGLAGVGVAALAVGGFFTWDAGYLEEQRDLRLMGCTSTEPCWSTEVTDYDRRGKRANTIAATSYVVGGAALATSIVMFVMARSDRAEAPIAVAPMQGGATLLGRFEF